MTRFMRVGFIALAILLAGSFLAPVTGQQSGAPQEPGLSTASGEMNEPRGGRHSATLLEPRHCREGTAPAGYPCGKVLVAGGTARGARYSSELYDPVARTWRPTRENMKVSTGSHVAVLLESGKVLVAAGVVDGQGEPSGVAQLFDPVADTWSSCDAGSASADCPGPMATPVFYTRAALLQPAFCLNGTAPPGYPCGQVLVAGGGIGMLVTEAAQLYNPATGRWSRVEDMNLPRRSHTMTLLAHNCGQNCGKVLVMGGTENNDLLAGRINQGETSAELFDPVTGSWTLTTPPIHGRTSSEAVLLGNGKVLISGGQGPFMPTFSRDPLGHSQLFDPLTAAWIPAATMTGQRPQDESGYMQSIPGNRVFATTRNLGDLPTGVEIYEVLDDATGAGVWRKSDTFTEPRIQNQSVTLLPCNATVGRVLIAGGTFTGQSKSYLYTRVPTISSVSSAAGPASGGTVVNVKGLGFKPVLPDTSGQIIATVGGRQAQVTRVSETELKVTTPPGAPATSAPIQVTVDGVPADTCGKDYKFDYLALPSITDIVPDIGPATGGATATLTGTGLAGATSVEFGGTEIPASEFQVNQEGTKLTLKSPSGDPGTVQVTVQTPGGISPPGQFTFVPVVSSLSPSAGDLGGGTPVIIRGKGFEHARSVRFGTTEAPFEKRSDTEIQTTSPAHRVPELVPVTVTSYPETNPAGLPSMAAAAGSNLFDYTAGVAVPPTGEGLGATAPSSGGTRVQTPSGPGTGSSGGSQPPPSGPASLSSLVQNQAPNLEIMNQMATQQSAQASSAGQIETARGLVDTGVVHSPKAAIAPRLEPNPQEAPQYHMVGRDDQANLAPGLGLALTSMLLSCLVIGGLGVRRGLDTPTDCGEAPAPAWGYVT